MKKSREIVGLSVVSIQEGKEIGLVKQLIVDAAAKSVAALLIDTGKTYICAKALPYSAVAGIGEYAVTINSESDLVDAHVFDALLSEGVQIIDSMLIAVSGDIMGTVYEFGIADNGAICECLVENAENTFSIPGERIITYGQRLIIASTETSYSSNRPVVEPVAAAAETQPIIVNEADVVIEDQAVNPQSPESMVPETDALAKLLEEKQRKYLLGKISRRRIEAENGDVIIDQGEEITEIVLQKAQLAGKFVELTMSIY